MQVKSDKFDVPNERYYDKFLRGEILDEAGQETQSAFCSLLGVYFVWPLLEPAHGMPSTC
eukprot:3397244-Amphidinium_carterae.1